MKLVKTALIILLVSGCASVKVQHTGETMKMSFRSDASEVLFYGSTGGYAPQKAEKKGKWWQVTIKDTEKLKYFLKADGEIYIPGCEMKEKDDFGGELCIYER